MIFTFMQSIKQQMSTWTSGFPAEIDYICFLGI